MSGLKIFLLGPPRVELDDSPVDIKRRKALAMLIYLAVTGQPHSRDALATLFYPDHSQSRARAYLRRDLAVLNTSFAGNWLDTERDTVEIQNTDQLWLDVERFRHHIATCQSHDHPPQVPCAECLPLLTEAVALYTDDFLAGFTLRDCPEFDDWQFFQAESLRQELATALESLVQGCSRQGNPEAAIPHARRWVALDPLHEPAQQALIQLYDQAGQQAAALRQYEEYVVLLEEELGLPPEEETTTLYEAVKAKRMLRPFLKTEQSRRPKEQIKPESDKAQPSSEAQTEKPAARLSSSLDQVGTPIVDRKASQTSHAVGRETELQQLHTFLAKALNGNRQLVFVTGETGVGKTTLVGAFLEQAITDQPTLWIGHGQCIEHHGVGEAYLPVLDALGRMCREPGGQLLISLLVRLAPTWLVQMPWLVSAEELEQLQRRVMAATRERMLREMVEAVEILTAERPLVLVLEDLHWSDYSTLDLLSWLAQRQERARLLLIGTYRPVDVKMTDHPLRAVIQEMRLREQCTELALPLLTEAATETYLAARFPGAEFPDKLTHLLQQRTAGNPLFIRTVVDSWVAEGALAQVNEHWDLQTEPEALAVGVPEQLRPLIEQQLRQLPSGDRQILEAASVAGVEFSSAAIAAAVGVAEEDVERRCTTLARRGQFLESSDLTEWADGTVAAHFRFIHHFYQEVLYERVPAAHRVRLHRQIGERLEAGYGAHAPERASELAMHFARGRKADRAVEYLRLAAEHAAQRSAPREAIELLRQGLELLREHSDMPDRARYELTLQAALGPALIAIKGWSAPEVEEAYVRARDLAHRLGDAQQLSQILYGLATLHEMRGEYVKSQALLEERLQLLRDPQNRDSLLESHELLACSTFHQGAFTQALDHADQGTYLYDARHHLELIVFLAENPGVSCHHWAGLTLWCLGYPDQALDRIHLSLDLAHDLSHSFSLAQANERAAMLHQFRREERSVLERAEKAIAVAVERGFLYWRGTGDILRGWALAVQGQYEQGIAHLRQGLETCQFTGATIEHPYFLALLAEAYSHAGQITEGLETLTEALALVRSSRGFFFESELQRLKGVLLLQANSTDNEAEAEASFQQALELARNRQAKSLELRAAVSLGRLWQEQGQEDEARHMLEEIYNWFTEGFETADLQEARGLLEELGGEVKPARRGAEEQGGRGAIEISAPPLAPALPLASLHGQKLEQEIRFCIAPDGVRIAYATVGEGSPLVKAANWLSHLEYDWQSPVWRHWLTSLSQSHTLVRYDRRGCGLSDWNVDDFSLEAYVEELETVVDSLGLTRFPLLALSGGGPVAITYAARHPEKVSHLILYGSYARGRMYRSQMPEQIEEGQLLLNMMKLGWGKSNPAFRQAYTSLFIPEGTAEQISWFNDLQRISTSPEIAARMFETTYSVDVSDLAPKLTVPTLILHARDDAVVPFEESRHLAALIPGARFVPLEGKNHILLEDEPAWQQFLVEVEKFIQTEFERPTASAAAKPALSTAPVQPPDTLERPTPPPNLPPQPGLFVGREQELAQLDAWLQEVMTGQGQVSFVIGDAGQGKTSLLQAFSRHAQAVYPELIVVGGNCNAYTGLGDPYLPFREILALLTGDVEAGSRAGILSQEQVQRLHHLLPSVMQAIVEVGPNLIGTFLVPDALLQRASAYVPRGSDWLVTLRKLTIRQVDSAYDSNIQQAALFEQYTKVLQAVARQAPLLLILDDLQWADLGSINLLFHLGRRLRGFPILILGAYRPNDVATGRVSELDGRREQHPLEPVVNEFQRDFGSISLNLEDAEGRSFIDQLLDAEPNRLGADFRQTLYQQTNGHPLFSVELLRAMQERGDLVKDETGRWVEKPGLDWTALPPRVEGAIGARINQLGPDLQNLLQIASIEGETFTAEVVAQLLQVDAHIVIRQCSQVLDRIHHLVRPEGIKHDGELRLSRYRFRHILIQRYLYHSLDEVERVHLNEAIGRAFEALYGENTNPIAIQLAWHYQEAGILEKAVSYLLQIGSRARRLSANEEAITHFTRALTLLEMLPDTTARAQRELEVLIALGPALMLIEGHSAPEVEQTYARAYELCQQVGSESAELFPALWGLWRFNENRGNLGVAQDLGNQCLTIAQTQQNAEFLLEAHIALGTSLLFLGKFTDANKHFEQVKVLYDPYQHRLLPFLYGDFDPTVYRLSYEAYLLWLQGYPDQSWERSEGALKRARELSHPYSLVYALCHAAIHFQFRQEGPIVQKFAKEAITLGREQGFSTFLGTAIILHGWALVQQGQAEDLTELDHGLAVYSNKLFVPYFRALLADACLQLGQIDEGLAALAEAMILVENTDERFWEAELYRLKGELLLKKQTVAEQANDTLPSEDCFLKAIEIARGQQAKPLELRALVSLARLWREQGREDEARQMLEDIYNWFTEGFETVDLQEARALLEELGGQVKPKRREAEAQGVEEIRKFLTPELRPQSETEPQVIAAQPPQILTSLSTPSSELKQRFVQQELIATGGMGEVYLGHNTQTGQPVAIKRLKPDLLAHNPEVVQRFIREGESLSQLNHPNIVKMLALLETDSPPAIVMEYVSGGTLSELLAQQPQLPLEQVLDLGLELADALARVHHVGIIHRDIKPGNVLLAEDGTPRLTDFGVAYLARPDTRLTKEGQILGTTVYMSPEAWRGEQLDARSDIWSFGAVLYEMLAGQPPFEAETPVAIMTAILNDPLPDLVQFRTDVPPALVELINQMLVKERNQRLDSMRQVAARLEMARNA